MMLNSTLHGVEPGKFGTTHPAVPIRHKCGRLDSRDNDAVGGNLA